MESLTVVLPGLFCAGGMALMMWLMMRGESRPSPPDRREGDAPWSTDGQIRLLRDEIARLRAEHASQPRDGVDRRDERLKRSDPA